MNPSKFILASSLSLFLVACTQAVPGSINTPGIKSKQTLSSLKIAKPFNDQEKNNKTSNRENTRVDRLSITRPVKDLKPAVKGPRKELNFISAEINQQGKNTQDIQFTFALPQTFSTQFLELDRISRVRFVVRGADLSKSYESSLVNFTDGKASAPINSIPAPTGKRRVVTAYGYDSNGKIVPAFEAWGHYLVSGTNNVTVVLNRTQMLVGRTLWELMQTNSTYVDSLDVETFQSNVEAVIMNDPEPDYVFSADPLYFDPTVLADYIADNEGTIPDGPSIESAQVNNQGVTLFIATQNEEQFAEDITLFLDDPASTQAIILDQTNSPARVRFENVAPGSWNLIARDSGSNELGRITVSVDHDGNATMDTGDLPGNPFELSSVTTRSLDCSSSAALPDGVIAVAHCGNDGDGSTWANAYTDLQDALDAAGDGDEIWVAAGVYKPDMQDFDGDISFQFPAGIAMYGGFMGSESARGDRDTEMKPILSGDLNGDDLEIDPEWNLNDMATLGLRWDNSGNIIEYSSDGTSERVLDGFIMRNGGADDDGGAIDLDEDVHLTINDVIFEQNLADDGGAIDVSTDDTVTISNCIFRNNYAYDQGGAVFIGDSTIDMTITNTLFEDNRAYNGGAVWASLSDEVMVTVEESIFRRNEAGENGGALGIDYDDYDSPQGFTVKNSTFENNIARGDSDSWDVQGGGAIFIDASQVDDDTSPYNETIIIDSIFKGNKAPNSDGKGGAILIQQDDSSDSDDCCYDLSFTGIYNSTFESNTAEDGGAIFYYFTESDPSYDLVNSIFYNNTARESGGAVAISDTDSTPQLDILSCTFVSNTAGNDGGALAILDASGLDLNIFNSIFWGNTADDEGSQIYSEDSDANINLRYSLIQDLGSTGISGDTFNQTSNISSDPLFISIGSPWGADDIPATADDGLRLNSGSPALNTGNDISGDADKADEDILGNSRSNYDMGAFEVAPPPA